MSKWFNKFKHLVKIDIKSQISEKLHIHIGKIENVTNNYYTLDYYQHKSELEKIIPEAIEEGYPLLQGDAAKLLEGAQKTSALPANTDLLEFYNNKIPPQDRIILRASMHIQQLYTEDYAYAEKVKEGLIQNYGKRGRNICRLYCEGYFAGFIKAAYEEMSLLPEFERTQFEKFYNVVVTESPQAVFVERAMDKIRVKKSIQQKIDDNKKYGIKKFKIHGIGKDNCRKIRESIAELEKEGIVTIEPEIEEKHRAITVTLSFE